MTRPNQDRGSRWHSWSLTSSFVSALAMVGCAGTDDGKLTGPATDMQADRAIRRAIRSSSEGVILLPSRKANAVYELPRLNEIAQELRQPGALCFLKRAIETMEADPSNERGFSGIPEGQAKIRARISRDGRVVRTELLESGFSDETMPTCLMEAVADKRWPAVDGGTNHHVDVVYWVSLGMQPDVHTQAYRKRLRRETAMASVRAKQCLQGRVSPGRYEVEGLNLIDREGATLVNRVEGAKVPEAVRSCIAAAFREVRLERQPESFVRPITAEVTFEVGADGAISVPDEDWLRLVQLEERAIRAKKRAELTGESSPDEPSKSEVLRDDVPRTEPANLQPAAVSDEPPSAEEDPADPAPAPERADPGSGGLRLNLGGRGAQR